jgi:nucleoside-diphosphate-sugar epimerase
MITNKKILITGGAGFLSSQQAGNSSSLCDYFIEKNNRITCLDNLSTHLSNNSETGTKHQLYMNQNLPFETACAGLPMHARRGASAQNRMGLSFCLLF